MVFVANSNGEFTLAAMAGLRDRENMFVDADGKWADGAQKIEVQQTLLMLFS